MQTKGRIFDDFSQLANGALGAFSGIKTEIETLIHQKLEKILANMALVSRDEFDAMAEVARTARLEQEKLQVRVLELEKKLQETEPES